MSYTLKQAAEAAGKTKPTILRAIQAGKISASRHEITGDWIIEPAELHRVYPLINIGGIEENGNAAQQYVATPNETVILHREIELRDEKIRLLQEERERERHLLMSNIEDLKQRLDRESEERRKLSAQITALLTSQEIKKDEDKSINQEAIKPEAKKGFFRRLFRG